MSFEEWKAELVKVTAKETGRPEYEIKINDQGAAEWFKSGWSPYYTFRETYACDGDM